MTFTDRPQPNVTEALFWPGSLGDRGLPAVLCAARAGGYSRTAVSPLTIERARAAGMTYADIRMAGEDAGVKLTQLDGVASWAPLRPGARAPERLRQRFGFSAERCLRMARELGLDSILAAGVFARGALAPAELVEPFARFCDAAAEIDVRVELEFIPFWGIPNLPAAWEIVSGGERRNAGLMIDTWHLDMGSVDLDADLALLARIDPRYLHSAQFADACRPSRLDDLAALSQQRLFPGDGELRIAEIIETLVAQGGLRRHGVEVFGPQIDYLSPSEAGIRCAECLVRLQQRLIQDAGDAAHVGSARRSGGHTAGEDGTPRTSRETTNGGPG